MSVVKKYQTGGKTSKTYDLEDYLAKKINEGKFTAKALPYVREAASNFAKLAKSGRLDEAYSFDPIKSEYSVNLDVLPDELKGAEWGGSKDEINKNVFGQWTANPDRSNKGSNNAELKKFNTLVSG